MQPTRILDGGMSRELARLGAELKQPEWSALALMNTPEIVRRVHEEFIAAGADIITTNSYALVPFHIGDDRFSDQGAELIALSGRVAREAVDRSGRKVLVAGCLPPIFGSYEPHLFQPDRVHDYLHVFVSELYPYVDLWLGETLSLIAEGEAVRQAVKQTALPLWVSFTLDDSQDSNGGNARLRSGERVRDAARWAAGTGEIDALLFNCSRPEVMKDAVNAASPILTSAERQIDLGVYANAFDPAAEQGAANETLTDTRQDLTGERYCRFASEWVDAGASIIGGCCGVGADHIHQIASRFKRTR